MSDPAKKKHAGYGLFAIAATVYTAGVVSFSIWSYHQQRTSVLAQVDQSLINATHSTEQILGPVFIECAVKTEASFDIGYATSRSNLDQFADDCQFDLIGAIGCKQAALWEIIFGGKNSDSGPINPSCVQNLLDTQLTALVQELAASENSTIRMQTIELADCGTLRVAVRYHPVTADTGYAILVARSTRTVEHLINTLAVRAVGIGIFLYAMAFPLIMLNNYARARSTRESGELHALLQQDFVRLKEREAELEDAIRDLERFNTVAIGRESRIIELKAEVNTLLEKMNQKKRYNIDHIE